MAEVLLISTYHQLGDKAHMLRRAVCGEVAMLGKAMERESRSTFLRADRVSSLLL